MAEFTDFQLMVFEKETIECHDVVALLGDYYDGELPAALAGRIEEHIAGCAYCQDLEYGYRKTIELARELRERPVPVDVKNRLRQNLNRRLGLNLAMTE